MQRLKLTISKAFFTGGCCLVTGLGYAQGAASAVPDLAGLYTGRYCSIDEAAICPEMTPEAAPEYLTARALAFADVFDELAAPKYDCAPATLPGILGDPYVWELAQQTDRVVLTYEKDDVVRTVWLEGHGHEPPRVGQFFTHGYSTGRYEGDELVVETTHIAFDPAGLAGDFISAPSSTQKRIIERYARTDDGIRARLTIEDPVFLLKPVEYTIQYRSSNRPLSLPWNCQPAAAQRNLRLEPSKYPQDPPVIRRN